MTIEKPRLVESREGIPTSTVELHFFRHSIKEKAPGKTDEEISITPEGKKLAKSQALQDTNLAQSVAFGSPRIRTQETAGLVMAGDQDGITGEESLDELRQKLDIQLGKGTKIGVNPLLDFVLNEESEYGIACEEAYSKHQYLQFIFQESDELALRLHDEENDTYSRMAARIASVVKRYVNIAPRFDKLVQDPKKDYTNTLERFFGTHQGVSESFLAKVIEKTKGVEERDEFVKALGNIGFDFVEGFGMDIQSFANGEQKLHVSFKKEKEGDEPFVFDENIPMELINQIIAEG